MAEVRESVPPFSPARDGVRVQRRTDEVPEVEHCVWSSYFVEG